MQHAVLSATVHSTRYPSHIGTPNALWSRLAWDCTMQLMPFGALHDNNALEVTRKAIALGNEDVLFFIVNDSVLILLQSITFI